MEEDYHELEAQTPLLVLWQSVLKPGRTLSSPFVLPTYSLNDGFKRSVVCV